MKKFLNTSIVPESEDENNQFSENDCSFGDSSEWTDIEADDEIETESETNHSKHSEIEVISLSDSDEWTDIDTEDELSMDHDESIQFVPK